MALKFKCKSKDEVPAEQAALYVERDGEWVLDVEGVVDKAKHDEFRNANVTLRKELEEQKRRFEGIDPDEVRKLAEEKQKLEETQQLKLGEVEKVLENRLKTAKADWDKQFGAVTADRDALNARLASIQIDQGVITVATKKGLRPTAIPDITARARSVFRLVNGAPTAFEADGKTVRVGKDGITPMNLEEWVDQQVADAGSLTWSMGVTPTALSSRDCPNAPTRWPACARMPSCELTCPRTSAAGRANMARLCPPHGSTSRTLTGLGKAPTCLSPAHCARCSTKKSLGSAGPKSPKSGPCVSS